MMLYVKDIILVKFKHERRMPVGLIEVGKTYVVSASQKKALTAEETFKHPDGREVVVSKVYRNGEITITIHTEDEASSLADQVSNGTDAELEFHSNDFSEWELVSSYDGQGIHFEYEGTEYEDPDYYEFLQDKGFESAGEAWTCVGGLDVFLDDEPITPS